MARRKNKAKSSPAHLRLLRLIKSSPRRRLIVITALIAAATGSALAFSYQLSSTARTPGRAVTYQSPPPKLPFTSSAPSPSVSPSITPTPDSAPAGNPSVDLSVEGSHLPLMYYTPNGEPTRDMLVGLTPHGCVSNPWFPAYYITITFHSDGTLSTTSTETLDGSHEPALYWGDDLDNPNRLWDITGIDGSGIGTGDADLYWQASNTIRPLQLSDIKLMGNHLTLTGYYQYNTAERYGPLNIQLIRQ